MNTQARPTRGSKRPLLSDTRETFLTVVEAAAFLRISPVTLARWRIEGRGPQFREIWGSELSTRDGSCSHGRTPKVEAAHRICALATPPGLEHMDGGDCTDARRTPVRSANRGFAVRCTWTFGDPRPQHQG